MPHSLPDTREKGDEKQRRKKGRDAGTMELAILARLVGS